MRDNVDYFERPIFVVGLPRSGTSLVAGCIAMCGAWTGYTVPGGGNINPKGFYENVYLRDRVNKKILSAAGADPLGVHPIPDLDSLPVVNGLKTTISDLLAHEHYRHERPWLFKEPKLTLTWPVFAHAFPHARWVVVRREMSEIVDSCLRTPFMSKHGVDPAFWANWAQAYLMRLDVVKQRVANCWEIWPQEMIDGDLADLQSLIEWLGLRWNPIAIRDFITPAYWQSKSA